MLPIVDQPIVEIEVSSKKKKFDFRPFTVKEEKLLLIAKESKTFKDIGKATLQVVNNCCLDKNLNIGSLPTFDIIYIFCKLIGASISNKISQKYLDKEDEKTYEVFVNMDGVLINYSSNHFNKIQLNKYTLELNYVPFEDILRISELEKEDKETQYITSALNKIYDSENVYLFKDETPADIAKFIDSLPAKAYKDIQNFFATTPKVEYKTGYTNSKGRVREISLASLEDFFMLA